MKLSVLDFSKIDPRSNDPIEALHASIALARDCDAWGYHRFWLAEHHAADVAHSCPEILMSVVAGVTERIRIGVAGVLLSYYSPLRIAKAFRLLNVLFPNRIDLGLARATVDPAIASSLASHAVADNHNTYAAKVSAVLEFLHDKGRAPANPVGVSVPEIWLLGTRLGSVSIAAESGTAFCLSLFADDLVTQKGVVLANYRDGFQPSPELAAPRAAIAVAGVCAPSVRQANEAVQSWQSNLRPSVVGTARQCRDKLEQLAQMYGVDEIVFLDVTPDSKARRRTYRLLADVFQLAT